MRLGIVLCLVGIGLPLTVAPLAGKFTGVPLFVVGVVGFLCGLGLILSPSLIGGCKFHPCAKTAARSASSPMRITR